MTQPARDDRSRFCMLSRCRAAGRRTRRNGAAALVPGSPQGQAPVPEYGARQMRSAWMRSVLMQCVSAIALLLLAAPVRAQGNLAYFLVQVQNEEFVLAVTDARAIQD